MPDAVQQLYRSRAYPPMSHPLADPAVTAVAARLGGLETPHPRRARILEIGCSSGHHLIPLALRWPESDFTGIDLAETAIADARRRATAAGAGNLHFHAADLRDFQAPDGPYDFIIAHGFFSWVPDDVKAALLAFCRKNLSPAGIATISFNVEAGWKPRLPVIAKVRAIQQAGGDEMTALAILRTIADAAELAIIDDMIAKGPSILPFDDLAPVNDAWPIDRFCHAAARAGLRWLGESDPGANIPPDLEAAEISRLRSSAADPLAFMAAVDETAGRTLRSGVLCRDDAPTARRISLETILDFAVRAAPSLPSDSGLGRTLHELSTACVPVREILPGVDPKTFARELFEEISRGHIRPRIEPVRFDPVPPSFPVLDPFRLLCARENLPLVDAWHIPCAFPHGHYSVLAEMDGTNSQVELSGISRRLCPDLAFEPWLRHLAGRGMFS